MLIKDMCLMYDINFDGFIFRRNIQLYNKLYINEYKSYSYLINVVKKYIRNCIRIKFPAIYITDEEKYLFLNIRTEINDSYVYKFTLDNDLNPIDDGTILNIDYYKPKNGSFCGPEDSRLIKFDGKLYLVSTMLTEVGTFRINLVDSNTGNYIEVACLDQELQTIEKNWSPFILDDELYFVYSIDPLRILKYISHGQCEYIYGISPLKNFSFDEEVLRGGTQFQLYQYPYFIGFCRTAYFIRDYKDYPINVPSGLHKMFMVVMRIDPFGIVYIGGPIILPFELIKQEISNVPIKLPNVPKQHSWSRKHDVINDPTSFCFKKKSKDSVFLGIDINSYSCIISIISGIETIMKRVIKLDSNSDKPSYDINKSANCFIVQRKVREYMEKYLQLLIYA